MRAITYTTDDPTKEYIRSIRRAKSKEELVKELEYWKLIADDALKVAKKFTDEDFKQFHKDWKKAKDEQPVEWIDAFNKRFGVIVMPDKLLTASITAIQYHVPFGTAYKRLYEDNILRK